MTVVEENLRKANRNIKIAIVFTLIATALIAVSLVMR